MGKKNQSNQMNNVYFHSPEDTCDEEIQIINAN